MQKATFAITIPHIISPISTFDSEANHKSSIQSLTLRFKVHETLQINQSNLLNSNPAIQNYRIPKNGYESRCKIGVKEGDQCV